MDWSGGPVFGVFRHFEKEPDLPYLFRMEGKLGRLLDNFGFKLDDLRFKRNPALFNLVFQRLQSHIQREKKITDIVELLTNLFELFFHLLFQSPPSFELNEYCNKHLF
jgi:hypothetical protein